MHLFLIFMNYETWVKISECSMGVTENESHAKRSKREVNRKLSIDDIFDSRVIMVISSNEIFIFHALF